MTVTSSDAPEAVIFRDWFSVLTTDVSVDVDTAALEESQVKTAFSISSTVAALKSPKAILLKACSRFLAIPERPEELLLL